MVTHVDMGVRMSKVLFKYPEQIPKEELRPRDQGKESNLLSLSFFFFKNPFFLQFRDQQKDNVVI